MTTYPGIKKVRANGNLYCYHRASGRRLASEYSEDPNSDFAREIAALDELCGKIGTVKTLGDLCRAYLASSKFKTQLRPRTQTEYRKVLHKIENLYVLPIDSITTSFVLKLRDKIHTKHGRRTANYVLQVISLIFAWGEPYGHCKTNPAKAVPKLGHDKTKKRKKANRPWTIQEFYTVLAAAKHGIKTAVALGGYAGVSEGDLVIPKDDGEHVQLLTDQNIKELEVIQDRKVVVVKVLEYTRSKTGVPVHQRLHSELVKILEGVKPGVLVQNRSGHAYTENGFRAGFFKLIRQLVKEGKVGEGLTFHGLRHFVGTTIVDEGGSSKVVASILGQKTVQMADHYSEEYDRRKKAEEGARLLESAVKKVERK
jgi:integrase